MSKRTLTIENLDKREMMAADAAISGATLTVNADPSGGEVRVSEYLQLVSVDPWGTPWNPGYVFKEKVSVSSNGSAVGNFDKANINRVVFHGSNQNDVFKNQTDIHSTGYGNGGNDELRGGSGADYFYGGSGNDLLVGQDGNDVLNGGTGHDRLYGERGNDVLDTGTGTGTDQIFAGDGDDLVFAWGGINWLYGDNGDDYISGGAGTDHISGGNGNDELHGGNGWDYLYGNGGRDKLFGDGGNDYLDGGFDWQSDELTGGAGADSFVRWGFHWGGGFFPLESENVKDFTWQDRYHNAS